MKKPIFVMAWIGLILILGTGCRSLMGFPPMRSRRATSVVQYLYPKSVEVIERPGRPVLRLPLRVGVAFVPDGERGAGVVGHSENALPEIEKHRLMETVAARFRSSPLIESIQLIPSTYLRPGGGFENLRQIRAIHGTDVMVLLSFDQMQFTDEGVESFLYWSPLGTHVIPGERNSTTTLLDAAVYDLDSRQLLFRAPGHDQRRGRSTPINLYRELREDSTASFQGAATHLVANLQRELDAFQVRAKAPSSPVEVQRRDGGGPWTGGAVSPWILLALFGGWLCSVWCPVDPRP